jgi:hypothetical protein
MPPTGAQKVPPEMMKQAQGGQPKPPVIQTPNPQQPIAPPTQAITPKPV